MKHSNSSFIAKNSSSPFGNCYHSMVNEIVHYSPRNIIFISFLHSELKWHINDKHCVCSPVLLSSKKGQLETWTPLWIQILDEQECIVYFSENNN